VFCIISLVFLLSISGCGANGTAAKTQSAGTSKTTAPTPKTQSTQTPKTKASTLASNQQPLTAISSDSILKFSWVDLKSDKVSPIAYKADGIPDGHFRVTMGFIQNIMIKSVFLRYSGYGKNIKWGWVYNNQLDGVGYILGVYEKGKLIKPGSDIGIKQTGTVVFDLYASPIDNKTVTGGLYSSTTSNKTNNSTVTTTVTSSTGYSTVSPDSGSYTYSFAKGDKFSIEVNYIQQNGTTGTLTATALVK
jgi:hypothetical protein